MPQTPPNWLITLAGGWSGVVAGAWILAQLRRRWIPTLSDRALAAAVLAFLTLQGLTTPWVLWSIAELVAVGRSGLPVTAARAAGLLAGLAAIPMLFYTYQGVLGRDLMWLDIAIFQIAVLLGFWVSWTVLRRRALAAPLWQVAGGAVLTAVWAAFIVWTFAPPELPLFVDPETGLRGIR